MKSLFKTVLLVVICMSVIGLARSRGHKNIIEWMCSDTGPVAMVWYPWFHFLRDVVGLTGEYGPADISPLPEVHGK